MICDAEIREANQAEIEAEAMRRLQNAVNDALVLIGPDRLYEALQSLIDAMDEDE